MMKGTMSIGSYVSLAHTELQHRRNVDAKHHCGIRNIIYDPARRHEFMLSILILAVGFFLVFSPTVGGGPVGRLTSENIPQFWQGVVLSVIGFIRMYGVLYNKRSFRMVGSLCAALIWFWFWLMSLGAQPPILGVVVYFWFGLNSLIVFFSIE